MFVPSFVASYVFVVIGALFAGLMICLGRVGGVSQARCERCDAILSWMLDGLLGASGTTDAGSGVEIVSCTCGYVQAPGASCSRWDVPSTSDTSARRNHGSGNSCWVFENCRKSVGGYQVLFTLLFHSFVYLSLLHLAASA